MDVAIFNTITYIWIGTGLITFFVLVFFNIKAPYGRHAGTGWGKMIDNHWGWFWMELPALLVMPLLVLGGPGPKNGMLWLLTGLWTLHYVYRTLIFPFQLRTRNKKMPLLIVFSALLFNLMNGWLNGYYLGFVATNESEVFGIHVYLGIFVFFGGMYINRTADRKLIALRKNTQGYQIPKGWLFNYISCPNHFGEIVEWAGFALIAWNLPASSFAIWTFCNLVPRALNHHEWYRQTFTEYPQKRKVVFPFIW